MKQRRLQTVWLWMLLVLIVVNGLSDDDKQKEQKEEEESEFYGTLPPHRTRMMGWRISHFAGQGLGRKLEWIGDAAEFITGPSPGITADGLHKLSDSQVRLLDYFINNWCALDDKIRMMRQYMQTENTKDESAIQIINEQLAQTQITLDNTGSLIEQQKGFNNNPILSILIEQHRSLNRTQQGIRNMIPQLSSQSELRAEQLQNLEWIVSSTKEEIANNIRAEFGLPPK